MNPIDIHSEQYRADDGDQETIPVGGYNGGVFPSRRGIRLEPPKPKVQRSKSLSIVESMPSIGKFIRERSTSFSAAIVNNLSSLKEDTGDIAVKNNSGMKWSERSEHQLSLQRKSRSRGYDYVGWGAGAQPRGTGNFGLWQTRVKDLLAQQGILKALRPTKPTSMEEEDWEELQQRVAGTIRLCLADEVMYHVMHLSSPDEIWRKLESQFMSKSLTTKLYLKQRLYGLKVQDDQDLAQHLNVFNQIISDLSRLDVKIEDEDKEMILLCSLPPSYEHMVTTLTYGKETIKVEEITAALLAHNQWKQNTWEISQTDSLYVKGNRDRRWKPEKAWSGKQNFRSKSRDKKTIHCYKCKKAGHMKRDCPKLKKQTDEKRDDSSKSVNVVEDDNFDCSEGDMLSISTTQLTDVWILDYGCSYHITPNREWFSTYRSVNSGFVYLGDDRCCNIVGIGEVRIKIYDGSIRTLSGVRYIPYLKKNLISLGTLHKNDFIPKADEDRETIRIVKGALTVMKGKMTAGNIYRLLGSAVVGRVYSVESCDDTTKLCYMRLAHLSERVHFKTAKHTTEGILDYVHSDKSDVFEKFKLWKDEVENQTGQKIKCLRSDNGTEYTDSQFLNFCKEHGIKRHFTVRKTPQQNGVAERMNRSSPKASLAGKVVEEVWNGHDVTFDHLQIFGCPTYVHVPADERSKLDAKSNECIFLGYKKGVKGFKFWDLVAKKIVINRDVVFYEHHICQQKKDTTMVDFEQFLWMAAMVEEMESLNHNRTWELVRLPEGKKPFGCKWVYKKKPTVTEKDEEKFKSLLALVASWDLHLEQMDVKTTFLHGDLEEQIYIWQPEGFTQPGNEHLVCRLKKSLYGLKQSPRQWYKRFDSYMIKIGYKQCEYDCCVYVKSLDDDPFIFLLLYVDDMLIAAKNMVDVIDLKTLLSQEFDMKDLGAAKKILGMEICRDRDSMKLWLSQRGYVEKMLERFAMSSAKPVSTPLANHFKLSSEQCPKTKICQRFRILMMLGIVGHGIVFGGQQDNPLVVGYVDSDYVVKELGVQQGGIQLLCDNQSTIHLAKNQVYRARTKHFDVRFHKIRELVASGEILFQKGQYIRQGGDLLGMTHKYTGKEDRGWSGVSGVDINCPYKESLVVGVTIMWVGGTGSASPRTLKSWRENGELEEKMIELLGPRCPEEAPKAPDYGINYEEDEEDELLEVVNYLRRCLQIQDRLIKMKMVKSCFVGADVVEAIINHLDCDRRKGIATAKMMAQKHFIHHVFGLGTFYSRQVPMKLNPLIHFGLCKGTRSSPKLRFFTAQNVQEELKAAAMEYFQNEGIEIDWELRTVCLTRIIRWFSADFGEN
ncbi:hypothetical protein F3Y22_tig00110597pilonHSYRG01396 [Hibiscus syriacus]|uniref:Uncharacterized protein n=1 Tax=Hibiscus syriacus TaxID=106335 RepID=A0A6A3A5E6_HIBSY|nr:hypothetical protein F3Y22_tig00110597pilonHSYRG01396 [Hibiscus syriacus]